MTKKTQGTLEALTKAVRIFRDERDWKQFHNPKDSAISLALEAGEVLEHFQFKNQKEIETYITEKKKEIGDELSDVLFWVVLMAYDLDIDLEKAFFQKLEENEQKYPVEKVKGKHKKYTEY